MSVQYIHVEGIISIAMKTKIQAIIVAGGRGKRLRPITDTIPKPMVRVAGKPILIHTLDVLRSAGITDYIFALCYLPHVIQDYFGDGSKFGVTIRYIFEDPTHPLGTAGAIKEAEKYVESDVIVTYADIIRELDVKKMIAFHKEQDAFGTLNVYKRFGKDPKSMVLFDKDNTVAQFVERPSAKLLPEDFVWANGSFYIFKKEVFDCIPSGKEYDFGKHVFPELLKENKMLCAFPTDDFFIDIGTKEKLEKAEKHFME